MSTSATIEETDLDVGYYGCLSTFVRDNFPPMPVINMADFTVDSDEEHEEIKDSTGKIVLL
jgi:predicted kinase